MCGVASLIVRKLWGVTQIWLVILVRLRRSFRTAFPANVSVDFLTWAMAVWIYGGYITGVKLPHWLWEKCEVWRRFDWWFLWGFERPVELRFPYVSIDFLRWAMTVWIYGDIHMCGVASLIVRKLWGVTQIWLMILVRLWKTFRTAFSVCLYRLFEVSYDCLNIWGLYHRCEVASLIVRETVRCDADLIDDSCEALKDLSNGVFRMSLSTFWGELWLFEYMGVISQVWSCLTNCEKTVRCDADLIDDSCEALKDLSNGVFRMSLSTFWGELWLFEYMVIYTCVELPH